MPPPLFKIDQLRLPNFSKNQVIECLAWHLPLFFTGRGRNGFGEMGAG
jgi:hypothetical protein